MHVRVQIDVPKPEHINFPLRHLPLALVKDREDYVTSDRAFDSKAFATP